MLKQDLYNTPEEKVKYEHDMTTERDRRNQLAFSYDKGVEEGRKQGIAKGIEEGIKKGRVEGREEGRNQERKDVLNKMKALGLPQETIDAILKQEDLR